MRIRGYFSKQKGGTRVKFKKLNMSVGTESVWCSRACSDSYKPLAYKQGEEIYDDLNANWRLPNGSAQWSWIFRIYLDLSIQLRNRQGSILRVQPTRCNFSQFILFIPVRRSTCFRRVFPSITRSSKLHIQRQDFMSMKNPLTPAGIEPATFRFVAQLLNHCVTAVPLEDK